MNSIPSIPQAAPSPSPIQAGAPAAADQIDRTNTQDFAGAMNAAGGKPARKAASKVHDSAPSGSGSGSGSGLPAAGNQPPPNAAPTAGAPSTGQAGTTAASGNAASGAAATAQAPGSAGGPAAAPSNQPNATPAAAEPVAAPSTTSAAAEELAAAASPTAADLHLPPVPDSASADTADTMPHATSIQTPPTPGAAQSTPSSAAPSASTPVGAAALPAPQVVDGTASKAEIAAATSAPTSTSANTTQNAQAQATAPSAADYDATAQAIMAAAVAQGTSAPSPDSSSSSGNLATPDTGVTLQGVAAANEGTAPSPNGLAAHVTTAATSASVTAATAAAIVQAISASADSGPTDKHSRDNSPDGSVGAAQLLTSNAPSDAGPTPSFKVSAGVDTADFGQGVADRVSLMMDGNLTSAKLQVNPPALGPIEVRIALQGGHAQVWMSSHSAVTRDALESSSPKLREMLGSQGFAQVSVDISQRSFQDRTPQSKGYENVSAIGGSPAAPVHASAATARSASGLLDAYA